MQDVFGVPHVTRSSGLGLYLMLAGCASVPCDLSKYINVMCMSNCNHIQLYMSIHTVWCPMLCIVLHRLHSSVEGNCMETGCHSLVHLFPSSAGGDSQHGCIMLDPGFEPISTACK